MAPIQYLSTRQSASNPERVGIETAIARGMPPDGGLYVPETLPMLPPRVFAPEPLSYAELAQLVLELFFPNWGGKLTSILEAAYGKPKEGKPLFDDPAIVPIRPISSMGDKFYIMELFHGRTCAFKDLALSLLGGFLRESLDRLGRTEPVLVLTATSGDTGSAALEGLSSVEGVHTAVFYPSKGTSEIQRLQMTSASSTRRFVAGLEGNFDDAQRAVKRAFARASAGEGPLAAVQLSSANSINIGRLLPQIVYYVAAWRALKAIGALNQDDLFHVAVPTGNFGNILAAKYAKQMGLPIGKLICASNTNKVLADFFATGVYDRKRDLVITESPSMDILVSSNLERLLYMAANGDGARVSALMKSLGETGSFEISEDEKAYLADFASGWCSDTAAMAVIAELMRGDSLLVDPHTATGLVVASRLPEPLESEAPVLFAATASPFKFPRACLKALAQGALVDEDSVDEDTLEVGHSGDLVLAARLAEISGMELPGPIAALKGKPVLHKAILETVNVEEALADYARKVMRARS